jgi:carbon storage regulator
MQRQPKPPCFSNIPNSASANRRVLAKTLAFASRDHYRKRACAQARGFACAARDAKGDPPVLVVSRKVGERLLIGDKIAITIVKVAGGAVRLGVEAPAELPVMREELALEIQEAEEASLEAANRSHL